MLGEISATFETEQNQLGTKSNIKDIKNIEKYYATPFTFNF